MLHVALLLGLTRGYAAEPSAAALRAALRRPDDAAPPPEVRAAWVGYAERTGDTLPVARFLETLAPSALTDPERALLLYDRARRAAWHDDADTLLALTELPPPSAGRAALTQPPGVLRAWLLRADLVARGPGPADAEGAWLRVGASREPPGATPEALRDAQTLRDHAQVELARAHAAADRPDRAERYAARIDERSAAFPDALALRAGAELALGGIGKGLGLMLLLDGPLAGRWFAPSTEVWAAAGAANACDSATARERLRRYRARATAVRATLDPGSPVFARLADGRLDAADPAMAPWIAADPELASLLHTIAGLRAEGAPALAADLATYTQGARQRLDARRAHAEAALTASDAFAARLEAAIDTWTAADPFRIRVAEPHRAPAPFNGEFWPGELDAYRVTYPRLCHAVPVDAREVDYG